MLSQIELAQLDDLAAGLARASGTDGFTRAAVLESAAQAGVIGWRDTPEELTRAEWERLELWLANSIRILERRANPRELGYAMLGHLASAQRAFDAAEWERAHLHLRLIELAAGYFGRLIEAQKGGGVV